MADRTLPSTPLPDYNRTATGTTIPGAERQLGATSVNGNDSASQLQQSLQSIVQGGATPSPSPAVSSATPVSVAAQPAMAPRRDYQGEIAKKRSQVAGLQQEAFTRATEFTPKELRNLSPGQQAELRRQRVTALSGQMGNLQSAIQTIQSEEQQQDSREAQLRDRALQEFNLYAKYGILGDLADDELGSLATMAGIDENAMKKIAEVASAGEPPELREVGGNLYAINWDPTSGSFKTTLVLGGGGGGGGGRGGSGGSSSPSSLVQAVLDGFPLSEVTAAQRVKVFGELQNLAASGNTIARDAINTYQAQGQDPLERLLAGGGSERNQEVVDRANQKFTRVKRFTS